MMNLSVVGLGKLGQCFAAVFAGKGFTVVGVDRDERTVASLRKGIASVQEPRLQDLITTAGDRGSAPEAGDADGPGPTDRGRYSGGRRCAVAHSFGSSGEHPLPEVKGLQSALVPGASGTRSCRGIAA